MDVTSYILGKNAGGGGSSPSGTINITENGTYDVTDKASAEVNVSGPELYVKAGDNYYKTNGVYYLAQNLDKAKVDDTSMDYIFYNCIGISSIPKLYSTKLITSAISAFGNCGEASKIDLSEISWASSNININSMFYGCNELDVLDISSLDFRNVTSSNADTFECGAWAEVSMGGYAEGIPYVYVKDSYAQNKVIQIASQKQYGGTWTTANVVIKNN